MSTESIIETARVKTFFFIEQTSFHKLILKFSYSYICSMVHRRSDKIIRKKQTDWVSETNRDGQTICYKRPERPILALNPRMRLTGWRADFLGLGIFAISY